MFVDHASLYNLVNETNLVHDLFLVHYVNFIYNLYMFRTSPCPSSGETTVFMRRCLVCRMEFHSILHTRQSAIQNNKYQVSHKYSCTSWWWTWTSPKHVDVINENWSNTLRINCAPSWFHLQNVFMPFLFFLIIKQYCHSDTPLFAVCKELHAAESFLRS